MGAVLRVPVSEAALRVALACMADAAIKGRDARVFVAAQDEIAAALALYAGAPPEPVQSEAK